MDDEIIAERTVPNSQHQMRLVKKEMVGIVLSIFAIMSSDSAGMNQEYICMAAWNASA